MARGGYGACRGRKGALLAAPIDPKETDQRRGAAVVDEAGKYVSPRARPIIALGNDPESGAALCEILLALSPSERGGLDRGHRAQELLGAHLLLRG